MLQKLVEWLQGQPPKPSADTATDFPVDPEVAPWIITKPFRGKDRQWYCRLKSEGNNEITWDTQGFKTQAGANAARVRFISHVQTMNFVLET